MDATVPDKPDFDSPSAKNRLQFVHELGFFEVLASILRKTKVQLTVPETFISGFGFPHPTLICTDYDTGELFLRENVSKVGLYQSCSFFEELNRPKGHLPITVLKTAGTSYFHDTCRPIFSPQEATSLWNLHLTQSRPQVMQRFVMGASKHAALIRATWDAASSRVKKVLYKNNIPLRASLLGPKQWKDKPGKAKSQELAKATYLVMTKTDGVMSAELPSAPSIDSIAMNLISLIEKFYVQNVDYKLSSLEADFIQDEKGFWYSPPSYLISLRSFKVIKHPSLLTEPFLKKKPLALKKTKSMILRNQRKRHDSEDGRLPRIKQWNKAIQKQREIITLVEARDVRKLNQSALF